MFNLVCIKNVVIREIRMIFGCDEDKAIFGITRTLAYLGLFLLALLLTGAISTFFASQNVFVMSALFGFLFMVESFVLGVITSLLVTAITIYYVTMIVKRAWYR